MDKRLVSMFPRWLFAVIAIGGLLACGLYLGMMRAQGVATGHLVRAIAYGALGLVMFWGALHRRP